MISGERRAQLHEWLDRLLDDSEHSAGEVPMPAWLQAAGERSHLADVIKFASEVAGAGSVNGGEDEEALSSPLIDDRRLALVAQRIAILAPLFPADDAPVLTEVCDELVAIAHGDAPAYLSRRVKTGPANGYKDARHKFGALLWSELLEQLGVPTAERQAWLSLAYGKPWDTMSRWNSQVEKYLGSDAVERAARHARHRWNLELQFDGPPAEQELRDSVFAAGRAYKMSIGYAVDQEISR